MSLDILPEPANLEGFEARLAQKVFREIWLLSGSAVAVLQRFREQRSANEAADVVCGTRLQVSRFRSKRPRTWSN